MKCQMPSPWGKKSKYGNMKLLYRALAHLFEVCKKINTVGLKGQGFKSNIIMLLICFTLNIFAAAF